MSERVMPHDLAAERSVLGGIVLDNQRLHDAAEHLQPAHFFRQPHRWIFAAMLALGESRQAIDFVTLQAQLTKTGELEKAGGLGYLSGLIDGVPRTTNVSHYAQIVRQQASLRALIVAGESLVAKAYEAHDDAAAVLEEAEQAILGLADVTVETGFESMQTVASRALDLLERAHQARRVVSGVPSGFAALDEMTRGFQPGTLVVIGARPGLGKTSIASNIADHAASQDYRVARFSLEMGNDELFVRQLAAAARIDSFRLQSGFISDREWGHLSNALGLIATFRIYADQTPAIAMPTLRSRLRRLKAEHGVDLVVIDYLQLMSAPTKRGETRALQIASITAALKTLARELKAPILLLAQLNRESVRGDDTRKPRLSDLRDSGSIEQDADVVLFLHRDEASTDEAADGGVPVEVIVAKHRNGATGSVKLSWHASQTRFADFTELREAVDQHLPIGNR